MNQREVLVATAAARRIGVGRGGRICPSVYWARVGQGVHPQVTRTVVMGR